MKIIKTPDKNVGKNRFLRIVKATVLTLFLFTGVCFGNPFSLEIKNETVGSAILNKEKEEVAISVLQQPSTRRITGTVKDITGEPVIGANVVEKGTTNGISTGLDGQFSLDVKEGAILEITYIGYISQEIRTNAQTNYAVTLYEDTQAIEEVVVVGYGTSRKSDLTGAISSVSREQIKERSSTNVLTSLAGQIAGVQIQQTQGAPGFAPTVKVRGIATITAGTTPLYVIDGIPLEDTGRNPLGMINPSDIESIEILKDASSAAIYGSRGANGVVIITTKSGSVGKTTIEASYEKGIQQVARTLDLMNSQEYIQFYIDARANQWKYMGRDPSMPNAQRPMAYRVPQEFLDDPGKFATTDWQDVIFRTALSDNAYVSVSGGSAKMKYMLSGSYLSQDGIVDRSFYQRFSIRTNFNIQLTDHLTLGSNTTFTKSKDRQYGTDGKEDVVSIVQQTAPIFPLYTETGSLGFRDPNSEWYRFSGYEVQQWHPYAITRETDNMGQRLSLLSNTFLEYKFLDHFSISTSLGLRLENSNSSSYRNEGQNWGWSAWNAAIGSASTSQTDNWTSETILKYGNTFGKHDVNAMLVYSAQENSSQSTSQSASNFPNDMVHTLNAGSPTSGSTSMSKWRLLSYTARLNYGFNNKYLLQATIRRDGSSRFGANNKWGYFPSASLLWRISEEDFLRDVPFLSQLRLRLSYGMTGNNQISNYGSWATLSTRQYTWGTTTANVTRGLYPSSIANPDLSWEKTGQWNAGINVGLFNNRIYFEADLYNSLTTDLLLNVPVPIITGFSQQLVNIGEVQNKGGEFSLTTKNITGRFHWDTNINISFNRNKVNKLGPDDAPIYIIDWGANKTEVGQPIANYFGYIFDGVFNNQAEIDAYPHHTSTTPGDPKVRDVNSDGKIDADDRTILGNSEPKFIYGMTNNFSYKRFDFSFMLQGNYGGDIMNSQFRYNGLYNGGRNAYKSAANYWKSESDPGDGRHFKPYTSYPGLQNPSGACTSLWVEDGTFLRIANIRLGYDFSPNVLSKIKLSSLRLYVNVDNVHVFSKYSGYDPENSTHTTSIRSGEDYGAHPIPRTISLGIKLGL